jgi:hypothetical protein
MADCQLPIEIRDNREFLYSNWQSAIGNRQSAIVAPATRGFVRANLLPATRRRSF